MGLPAASSLETPAWGDHGSCGVSIAHEHIHHDESNDRSEVWLQAHNHYRKCHGVPAVTWSHHLARYAKVWVHDLLEHCDGVMDMSNWAQAGSPDEQRPHDPNSYLQSPANGENIWSGQGVEGPDLEIEAVEGWYREVSMQCPDKGHGYGCGGIMNHFTALIWKDVRQIGCYSAVRHTPQGPFIVSDCRYSPGDGPMEGCNLPNTNGCGGDGFHDGKQVPPLVGGQCPKAIGTATRAAPVVAPIYGVAPQAFASTPPPSPWTPSPSPSPMTMSMSPAPKPVEDASNDAGGVMKPVLNVLQAIGIQTTDGGPVPILAIVALMLATCFLWVVCRMLRTPSQTYSAPLGVGYGNQAQCQSHPPYMAVA